MNLREYVSLVGSFTRNVVVFVGRNVVLVLVFFFIVFFVLLGVGEGAKGGGRGLQGEGGVEFEGKMKGSRAKERE